MKTTVGNNSTPPTLTLASLQRAIDSISCYVVINPADEAGPTIEALRQQTVEVRKSEYVPVGLGWIRIPPKEGVLNLSKGQAFLVDMVETFP